MKYNKSQQTSVLLINTLYTQVLYFKNMFDINIINVNSTWTVATIQFMVLRTFNYIGWFGSDESMTMQGSRKSFAL